MKWILPLVVLSLLVLGGCKTDLTAIRAKIDEQKQTVQTLAEAAGTLQKLAESTGDPQYIAAAASAQKALTFAKDKIPEMENQLAKLKDGAPWWNVAIAVSWPFVVPLLKLIPGPGGAVATAVAELAFRMNATREAKEKDRVAHALLESQTSGAPNAPT